MLRRTGSIVTAAVLSALFAGAVSAQQVRIDFGSSSGITRSSAGQNWVNVTNPYSDNRINLVNYSTGAQLPWTIAVSNDFGGTVSGSSVGTQPLTGAAATLFPATAANDGFRTYSGYSSGQFTLRNLDPNLNYSFNLFASASASASTNLTGLYSMSGANTVTGTLNATNNRSNLLSFSNIRPDANRQIKLRIDDGAGNNSYFRNAFINGLTISAASTTPAPEVAKNVLMFGNSFTFLNDMPASIAEIAVADRHVRPNIVVESADSRSLTDQIAAINANPANNINKLPAGQQWSNVIMQEYSTGTTTKLGDPAQFKADTKTIYNAVKANSPGVKPVLYETWAYMGTDTNVYGPASYQYANPAAMQADIRAAYAAAASELNAAYPNAGAVVAAAGDQFEKLSFNTDLYGGYDTKHPGPRGSLIAALMLYKNTYNENVSDIPWSAVQAYYAQHGIVQADWLQMTALVDGMSARAASFSVVPEPTAICGLAMGMLLMRRRR